MVNAARPVTLAMTAAYRRAARTGYTSSQSVSVNVVRVEYERTSFFVTCEGGASYGDAALILPLVDVCSDLGLDCMEIGHM